jgi:putative oxidoreductase
MAGLGLCVLRLVLAVVFVAHGAHKLFGSWPGPGIGPGGLEDTAKQYAALGLPSASLLAILSGVIQFAGGILVGAGLLTRSAALALLAYIGLGVYLEHFKWGFFLNWTRHAQQGLGIEYSLVLAGALICLLFTGGGEWSIDGRRSQSQAQRAAGRARLRGKL